MRIPTHKVTANPSTGPVAELKQDQPGKILDVKKERGRAGRKFAVHEPPIDLYEGEDAIIAQAELPGLTKDKIQVNIVHRLLTIEGEKPPRGEVKEENCHGSERADGWFTRAIELPADVKLEEVKAIFKDGVLTIRLPKTEEARGKIKFG